MRVTKNQIVGFTASNLTEDTPAWLSTSLYNYTQEVSYLNFIYRYAGENGTKTTETPDISTKWIKIRASNTTAMLDNKPSTQSVQLNKIEVSFISKGFDKLAFLNVIAKDIKVEITPLGYTQPIKTIDIVLLNTSLIKNLRDFATAELEWTKSAYINIPVFYNAIIKVTINNAGNIAKCGHLISGKSFYIGSADWDINMGLTSFKNKKLDDFGDYSYINRGITDNDSFKVTIDTKNAPAIKQKIKELDGLLLLFVILENSPSLKNVMNFGYWEDFYILLSGPVKSEANLKIQGVL